MIVKVLASLTKNFSEENYQKIDQCLDTLTELIQVNPFFLIN